LEHVRRGHSHDATIFGPIIGAAIIISIQNYLNKLGAWVTIVEGTIFIICVLLFGTALLAF